MHLRTLSVFAIAALTAVLLAGARPAAPVSAPEPGAADGYTVDVTHSMLVYKLRHFGVSYFWGRILMPKGSFRIVDGDLDGSYVNVVAEIKHMDAGNEGRNRFLKSPDFFNVREYPTAEFKSTSVRKTGERTYEAAGEFTLHGVTKAMTVPITEWTELETQRFGHRAGFECIFRVKRSEFGMDLFVEEGTLGDEVTIIAAIEGVRQP